MSVIQFNVAQIVITPVLDINGNPVVNPTPILIDGIQSVDLNLKSSIKTLMAEKQFAIAGARGESTVEGKIKAVKNSAELIASLYTGQGYTTSTPFQGPLTNLPALVGATPFTVTVGPAGEIATGTGNDVTANLGVVDSYGIPLTRVASGPVAGVSYTVAIASGVATYTFAAGDAAVTYYFSVMALTATPPTGVVARGIDILNLQGGATPVVQLALATSFQGKKMTLVFPWTIASNLNLLNLKNLEFSGFEIDFSCFPDQTVNGTIMTGYVLE